MKCAFNFNIYTNKNVKNIPLLTFISGEKLKKIIIRVKQYENH